MTVRNICHTLWDQDGLTHLCGKPKDHQHWHLCACGAFMLMGRSALADDVAFARSVDCPDCLARVGRPCVARKDTGSDLVMTGVHASRQSAAERRERSERRRLG